MQNKNSGFKVMGVLLILIGFILPWRCYSGFTLGCDQSFSFNLPGNLFSVPESYGFFLVVVVFLALGLNTAGFDLKRILLVLASALTLALTAIISIAQTLFAQFGSGNGENMIRLQVGLPLILLGAWLVASFQPLPESGKKQLVASSSKSEMSRSPDWLN